MADLAWNGKVWPPEPGQANDEGQVWSGSAWLDPSTDEAIGWRKRLIEEQQLRPSGTPAGPATSAVVSSATTTAARSTQKVHRPGASATAITLGLIFSVVGAILFQVGDSLSVQASQRQALLDSIAELSNQTAPTVSNSGAGWLAFGGILALVGVVFLIVGVVRLATAVDWLVSTKHAELVHDLNS